MLLGPVRGVLFSSGLEWREQRNFILKSLGDFGLGKSEIEGKIWVEALKLRDMFVDMNGEATDLNLMMNIAVVNTLWSITVSDTIDLKDEKVKRIIQKIDKAIKVASHMHPLSMLFPFLTKAFPKFFGVEQMDIAVSSLKSMIDKHVEDHMESFNEEKIEDFLDMYILLRKKSWASTSSTFFGNIGNQNQQIVLLDLFLAGVETTTTSLLWAILFLLHHPEVQEKIYEAVIDVNLERDGIRKFSEEVGS